MKVLQPEYIKALIIIAPLISVTVSLGSPTPLAMRTSLVYPLARRTSLVYPLARRTALVYPVARRTPLVYPLARRAALVFAAANSLLKYSPQRQNTYVCASLSTPNRKRGRNAV
jgi:hypothetical protein